MVFDKLKTFEFCIKYFKYKLIFNSAFENQECFHLSFTYKTQR